MKKIFIIILMFVSVSSFGQEVESMIDSLKFYYQETDKYDTMMRNCYGKMPSEISFMPQVYSEEQYDSYYDTYGYKVAKSYKNYYEYKTQYVQYDSKKDSVELILKTMIVENIKESKLVSEKRCTVKNYKNVIDEFCDLVGYEYWNGCYYGKDSDWKQFKTTLSTIRIIEKIKMEYYRF